MGGDPGADPGDGRGIAYPIWPGNASVCPGRSWSLWQGRRKVGVDVDGWMRRSKHELFKHWLHLAKNSYFNQASGYASTTL